MAKADEWGIKAIAFDIDGTLYPKRELNIRLIRSSILHLPFALRYNMMRRKIRKEDGARDIGRSDLLSFQEREAKLMYPSKERSDWFRKKEAKVFTKPWEKSFSSIKGYPGMKEALKCAGEKYSLAVLSDFPIGVKLDALEVREYISVAFSSGDIGALKPSATPFLALLEALSLDASEVLYVGDSEHKDVQGAKGVGMKAALISPHPSKVYSKADYVFSSWKDFKDDVIG